jgi:hypothetical protein
LRFGFAIARHPGSPAGAASSVARITQAGPSSACAVDLAEAQEIARTRAMIIRGTHD